jgi:DNA-binding CsgD family transcriptional regulator
MKSLGVDVVIVDIEDALKELAEQQPQSVGLDVQSLGVEAAVSIASELNAEFPEMLVLLLSPSAVAIDGDLQVELSVTNSRWITHLNLPPAEVLIEILNAYIQSQKNRAVQTAAGLSGLLTPQQHRVMQLVASGSSNASIARTCGISTKAVERTISSASKLMHVAPASAETNHRVTTVNRYLSVIHNSDAERGAPDLIARN